MHDAFHCTQIPCTVVLTSYLSPVIGAKHIIILAFVIEFYLMIAYCLHDAKHCALAVVRSGFVP